MPATDDDLDSVERAHDVLDELEAVENECPQPGEFSWDLRRRRNGELVGGAEQEEAEAIATLSKHAFALVTEVRAARAATTLVGDDELRTIESAVASLKQVSARADTGTGRVTVVYESTDSSAVHAHEQMKTLLVELKRLRAVERQLRAQLGAGG